MLDLVEEKYNEISQLKEAIVSAKKEKEDEVTVLSMEVMIMKTPIFLIYFINDATSLSLSSLPFFNS